VLVLVEVLFSVVVLLIIGIFGHAVTIKLKLNEDETLVPGKVPVTVRLYVPTYD
jgi:hypothetical protein